MSLSPAILAHRLEAAARHLSADNPDLAHACAEAAAFFREEFDVPDQDAHAAEASNTKDTRRGRR